MTLLTMAALALLSFQSGTMSGRVRSAEGGAAKGVRIFAIPADFGGGKGAPLRLEGITRTDNSGRFRLEGLAPGRYYIAAGPLEAITLYPGVTNIEAARSILASGSPAAALDFTLDQSTADMLYELTHVPENPGAIESTDKKVTEKTKLTRGQTLQVEHGKIWWASRILDLLPDGRVKIHYLGWAASHDEIVPRSRLQLDDEAIEKTQHSQRIDMQGALPPGPPNTTPICREICTVVAASAAASYRFGADEKFTSITSPAYPLVVDCNVPCSQLGDDPLFGIVKGLYAVRQDKAYTVTWKDNLGTTHAPVTVPALPAAPRP